MIGHLEFESLVEAKAIGVTHVKMHRMLVGIVGNGAFPSARLRSLELTNQRVNGPIVSHYS